MFYTETPDLAKLRFGDVVVGGKFLASLHLAENANFKIDIGYEECNVVLTPCCSIRDGIIALSPLVKVLSVFFNTPFFKEDLLNINKISPPERHFSPEILEARADKELIRQKSPEYPCSDFFIYAPDNNGLLKEYNLSDKRLTQPIGNIRYYMIDFKNTYQSRVKNITGATNVLLQTKKLELSIESRKDLLDKIKAFYRQPKEDFE